MACDSKINNYRITIINSVIGYIADISKGLGKIKKPDSLNLLEKSGSVPGIGLEPIRPQWSQDFKSCVSTNSTTWAFRQSKKIPLELEGTFLERKTGFEPATSTLARSRSTN